MDYSTTLCNNQLNQIQSTCGTTANLKFYTGSPPATPEDSATGTLLCTISLASGWFPAASGGSKSKSGTWAGQASADGTPGYFRLCATTGNTCHVQGTVDIEENNPDMVWDGEDFVNGETVVIDNWTITHGNFAG